MSLIAKKLPITHQGNIGVERNSIQGSFLPRLTPATWQSPATTPSRVSGADPARSGSPEVKDFPGSGLITLRGKVQDLGNTDPLAQNKQSLSHGPLDISKSFTA